MSDLAQPGHTPRRFLVECSCGKQIDRDKYDEHVLNETTNCPHDRVQRYPESRKPAVCRGCGRPWAETQRERVAAALSQEPIR